MSSTDLEQEYFIELEKIFEGNLDVLSAEIENDLVQVNCSQRNNKFDYCGGTLNINCAAIKVNDQNKHELTIEKLSQICMEYWDEFQPLVAFGAIT